MHASATDAIVVRTMEARDVEAADRVYRLAFGRQFELSDPMTAFGDAQTVRTRFASAADWAFVAERNSTIVGAVFAVRYGSYGFFGPLAVDPEYWNAGIATRLLVPVLALFDDWGLRVGALFTFAHSTKHLHLYQKLGFWPQFLTAVFERKLEWEAEPRGTALLSERTDDARAVTFVGMRDVTDAIFSGLDLSHEATTVLALAAGDVVLVEDDGRVVAFAICYLGRGETPRKTCLIKFAMVEPSVRASEHFDRLLDGCEALAYRRALTRMTFGVNTAHHGAYARVLERGYGVAMTGVLMHRPNDPGFARADIFALGDLR